MLDICYKDKGQNETAQVSWQLCEFDANGPISGSFSVD